MDRSFVHKAIGATVLIVICGFVLLWTRSMPDVRYKGRWLSDYLYDAYQPFVFPLGGGRGRATPAPFSRRPEVRKEAEEALRALGPKAVPLLASWLGNSSSSLRDKLHLLASTPSSRLS